jgi:hypothetical protein
MRGRRGAEVRVLAGEDALGGQHELVAVEAHAIDEFQAGGDAAREQLRGGGW